MTIMRRISLTVLGTIAMLVLLLRYPISFGTSLASPPAAVNSPPAANATSSSTLVLTGVSALSVITAVFVTVRPLTTDWTDRGYLKVDRTGQDGGRAGRQEFKDRGLKGWS